MKNTDVFISWSGPDSKACAAKLKSFLIGILPTLEVFLSTEDISSGERWLSVVSDALENAKFGVVVVTLQNIQRPWIHFEAGALSKSVLDGRVVPLLCGIGPAHLRDTPLAGFQAEMLEEAGIKSLLKSIRDATGYRMNDVQIERSLEKWWVPEGAALVDTSSFSGKMDEDQSIVITLEDVYFQVSELETQIRDLARDLKHPQQVQGLMTGPRRWGLLGGAQPNALMDLEAIKRLMAQADQYVCETCLSKPCACPEATSTEAI